MLQACVMFKPSVAYRREVFCAGLQHLGYQIVERPLVHPDKSDLIVMWNRNIYEENIAKNYEGAGATLIIAENGYIGKDADGHKLFALAKRHHNGAGLWHVGQQKRGNIALAPWRDKGDHLLLLPQRGIGAPGVAMPRSWVQSMQQRLKRITSRPIRTRYHPGAAKTDPIDDLKGAHAAITWGSGAAIKALAAGYPVFHEMKAWIGASAATHFNDKTDIEQPFMGDRLPMFERLAWAQWSVAEIESGEAFSQLLRGQGVQDFAQAS